MKRYLIDTNIILRFLLKDDAEQYARVAALFREANDNRWPVRLGREVVAETVWALRHHFDQTREKIADDLIELIRPPMIQCDNKPGILTALARYRDTSLDIVDCLIAAEVMFTGEHLATFDKKIGKKFPEVELWDQEA